MIASLHGEVLAKEERALVIQLGGLGLRVYVPDWLREGVSAGEKVTLHTYLLVREQELALYGFDSAAARNLFETLLGVNGVGPRVALAVLSALSLEALQRAVFNEQPEILARVPGIGKKTAQKIIFQLKDRLQPLDTLQEIATLNQNDEEVLAALTALGYSVVEAQAAIQSLPPDAPDDVEERLRLALRHFTS